MTPERWKQIEELYHRADALPSSERSAFLIATCPDEAIRADVLALLANDNGFLDRLDIGAARRAAAASIAVTGRLFGQYQIEDLLGAGGMGEVYRARDLALGRDVAIKLLPPGFTTDSDRLARLEREAQVLAALNHPNICAIYGSAEADGTRFLVLELVEGQTLADRLAEARRKGTQTAGLPLAETRAVARQIVDGLEAAHNKGIIHRDLKPANVMITPDGVVKVLDFGLAKNIGPSAPLRDLTIPPGPLEAGRWPAAAIGTAAYMSPEQARGLPLDERTDIWSFGCILYEMLTGEPAFAGNTVSDTIVRILERDPDWSALPSGVPAALRRILVRCLAKDAKKRLRDVGDARIEFDAVGEILPAGPDTDVERSTPRRSAWLVWIALAAVVTAVAIMEGVRRVPPKDPVAGARFTPITDWEGMEAAADISPDGRFVTFLADRDGQFELWWTQIGTGQFNKLKPGGAAHLPPSDTLKAFGFSGDGADIWTSLRPGSGVGPNGLFALTGGPPRPILGDGGTAPAWSPDGERLVYMKIVATGARPPAWMGDVILVADRAGGDPREIVAAEPQVHNHNPVWSTDGQWIYFARGVGPIDSIDTMDVWRVKPSGGRPERVTSQNGTVSFLAPLDTRTLLYVGRSPDGSGPSLWFVDLEQRNARPRRFTVGVEQYTSVAASRDGRHIVTTVANPTSSLWRVPLRDSGVDEREVERYVVPADRTSAPRFGGSSVFYLASSGGSDGLWRLSDGQPLPIRRGADGEIMDAPAITRDGGSVAFVALRSGERRLTVMSSDGTSPRTIAPSMRAQGSVDWSPDGRTIVTGAADDGSGQGPGLYTVPLGGGAPSRLVRGEAFDPVWSPDGGLIVYVDRMAGSVPLLAVRPDGSRVDIPRVPVRAGGYRFLPGGRQLVYMPHLQSQDFWLLDLEARTTHQITRLENRGALRWFDVTADGRFLVFDRSRANANVVLIELPK